MQLVRTLAGAPRGAHVAIGNFDGVHRGHRALLNAARAAAEAAGRPLAALVFEPHPREFFQPDAPPFRLTPLAPKARLLEAAGVAILYALPFDTVMAGLGAEDFVRSVLIAGLGAAHVVIGADFQFGRGRSGDAAVLEQAGRTHGFGVTVVAPVGDDGEEKISSSDIRAALQAGDPVTAARLLGHPWTIEGEVLHGDKRGRTIGFPTANLVPAGYLEPAHGVYAVRVTLPGGPDAGTYAGVANLGRRPTFGGTEVRLEVHLFDYAGDLYGRTIAVAFHGFIRGERRFEGLEALKTQIAADCGTARVLLAGG